MKRTAIATGTLGVLVAGCMNHVYVPTDNATARLPDSGVPASSYPVPADAPRGNVQVATLGTRKLKDQPGFEGGERKVLALRLVVTNNSDQPWRFEPARQRLTFADGREAGPALVYGTREPGQFAVAPRTRESFDLIFDVPEGGHPLDHLELAWSVQMPDRLVTNRSDFRREEVQPPSYYAGPYYPDSFYGPPSWYYPYPWFGGGVGMRARGPYPFDGVGRFPRFHGPPPLRVPPPAGPESRSPPR